MAKRTKKVGITGKYGTRYGASLRREVKKLEVSQHSKYQCEFCGKKSVKRVAVGIWKCKACGKEGPTKSKLCINEACHSSKHEARNSMPLETVLKLYAFNLSICRCAFVIAGRNLNVFTFPCVVEAPYGPAAETLCRSRRRGRAGKITRARGGRSGVVMDLCLRVRLRLWRNHALITR